MPNSTANWHSYFGPVPYATDPTLINKNYVFNPSNTDVKGDAPPASFDFESQVNFTSLSPLDVNTHFVGSDVYFGNDSSGGAVLGDPSALYLVADLLITYTGPAPTNSGGDVFNITIDTLHTSFSDGYNNPIGTMPNYDSNGGNVFLTSFTVLPASPASAVPEPSTLALALSSILTTGVMLSCRRG